MNIKTFKTILIIIVLSLLCLAAWLFLARPLLQKYYLHQYYYDLIKPAELEEFNAGVYPSSFMIKGIPWISYSKYFSHSTTMQMIAYYHGIEKPVDYYSFLMGHTYGAVYLEGKNYFYPATNPEPGFQVAASILGLEKYCQVSDHSHTIQEWLRYYLSRGYPVCITWNSTPVLKFVLQSDYYQEVDPKWVNSLPDFFPQSALLIGYDQEGFFYYETGGEERFWNDDREGIKIPDHVLLEAIESYSDSYQLPWRFMFTIFKAADDTGNISVVWQINAQQITGIKIGPVLSGVLATQRFAADIQETEPVPGSPSLLEKQSLLEKLIDTRADNVLFLRSYFSDDEAVEKAASHLSHAVESYEQALSILKQSLIDSNDLDTAAGLLLQGADHELNAAAVMNQIGSR